jgi:uncharacterized MnhB-related membrane protein
MEFKVTKVHNVEEVSDVANTLVHLLLASFLLSASLLIVHTPPHVHTNICGSLFGLLSALLFLLDAVIFLVIKRRTASGT